MLPIPKDPNFKIPPVSEHDFFNPTGDEDERLLKTGAWNHEDNPQPESPEEEAAEESQEVTK